MFTWRNPLHWKGHTSCMNVHRKRKRRTRTHTHSSRVKSLSHDESGCFFSSFFSQKKRNSRCRNGSNRSCYHDCVHIQLRKKKKKKERQWVLTALITSTAQKKHWVSWMAGWSKTGALAFKRMSAVKSKKVSGTKRLLEGWRPAVQTLIHIHTERLSHWAEGLALRWNAE